MNKKIFLIAFCSLYFSVSCSLDVQKAVAPTAPPTIQKNQFKVSDIEGAFSRFEGEQYREGVAPKMFLWPTQKWDESQKSFVNLSFDEQVGVRTLITAQSEDLADFEKQMETADSALIEKYDELRRSAILWWQCQACYSLCSEDAFFCLPDDETNLEIDEDDWKFPESPEEEELILACQENQEQRKSFDTLQKQEFEKDVRPLQKKAGDAALGLLKAVGDENYFGDLSLFQFYYGAYDCQAAVQEGQKDECLISSSETRLFLRLKYGDVIFSNFKNQNESYAVTDIQLDILDGYVSFKIPAIDLDQNNEVYGHIFFDLEFVKDDKRLQINGDIKVYDQSTGQEKMGRFASSGTMIRPEVISLSDDKSPMSCQ